MFYKICWPNLVSMSTYQSLKVTRSNKNTWNIKCATLYAKKVKTGIC